MKMRFLAVFLWAAVSCCCAQINPGASTNTISISGDAEIKVVPDRANVYLGVETRNKDIAAASAQNDTGVRQVLAAIRRVGVDSTDIQTDFYHVEIVYLNNAGTIVDYYKVKMREVPDECSPGVA